MGFGPREGVAFTREGMAFSASRLGDGRADAGSKFICKLDRKHRMVLPLLVRERLGVNGIIQLSVRGSKIEITIPERKLDAMPISRNCSEVRGGITVSNRMDLRVRHSDGTKASEERAAGTLRATKRTIGSDEVIQ